MALLRSRSLCRHNCLPLQYRDYCLLPVPQGSLYVRKKLCGKVTWPNSLPNVHCPFFRTPLVQPPLFFSDGSISLKYVCAPRGFFYHINICYFCAHFPSLPFLGFLRYAVPSFLPRPQAVFWPLQFILALMALALGFGTEAFLTKRFLLLIRGADPSFLFPCAFRYLS